MLARSKTNNDTPTLTLSDDVLDRTCPILDAVSIDTLNMGKIILYVF